MAKETRTRGGAFAGERPCAHPGCGEPGQYRAPTARPGSAFAPPAGPPAWQYLCLEHVRAFNAGWNWFEGLDADAQWEAHHDYPNWDRETRAFAHNAAAGGPDRVADALGILRWKADRSAAASPLSREDRQALAKLGLGDSATLAEVKAKYRALARRYHPDTNGGDRSQEGRLQALTEAQTHLAASESFRNRASGGRA